MSPDISVPTEILRRLHRIHQQLQDLRDRLDRGPRLAKAHQGNLAKLQEQLTEAQAKAKAIRTTADLKQGQLQSGEAAVAKRRNQLREAKDNREYQALLEQIAADEMANSVLADEALEALDKHDQLNAKVAEAQAALDKGSADALKTGEEYQRQAPLIRGDIKRLEVELHESEKELPGEFREVYRRVTRAKGSDAMAPMLGEFCGGCNQHVPLNMFNELFLGRPIFCKSCGRLLYLPEDAVKL